MANFNFGNVTINNFYGKFHTVINFLTLGVKKFYNVWKYHGKILDPIPNIEEKLCMSYTVTCESLL